MRISSRLSKVSESTTMAIAARAAELRAAGRDVISLSAGEPDFDTPEPIAERGVRAIRGGNTHYTAAAGSPELRRRVAEAMARDFGFDYGPSEVCVTAGTKPAIWLALQALLEAGDEVVVLAPYWVSYPAMVAVAGGTPRILRCSDAHGFLPDLGELEQALRRREVRGLVLNSPSNPTGAVWSEAHLAALVELCRRHDCWIVSDEIYSDIRYGDVPFVSPASMPGARERTVVVNGLSKSFAMTGWRLGWLAGPEHLVRAVSRIQSQCVGNACSISQEAALEALEPQSRDAVGAMVRAFAERRGFLIPALEGLPGMTLCPPVGAFYAFPGVGTLCEHRGCDDVGLVEAMLEEIGVAVVPGSAFGSPGFVRFSFAASLDDLGAAVSRLQDWLQG